MSDRLVGLLLLALSGYLYWQTTLIRRPTFAAFEALGSETFPRGVLVVLALFSVALVIRGDGAIVPRIDPERVRNFFDRYRLPLLTLALFVVYIVAIERVGWLPSTIAFLVALQIILRPRRGRDLAFVVGGSALFAIGIAQVFERVLRVILPRGTLF